MTFFLSPFFYLLLFFLPHIFYLFLFYQSPFFYMSPFFLPHIFYLFLFLPITLFLPVTFFYMSPFFTCHPEAKPKGLLWRFFAIAYSEKDEILHSADAPFRMTEKMLRRCPEPKRRNDRVRRS